jgi:hypothetical protein
LQPQSDQCRIHRFDYAIMEINAAAIKGVRLIKLMHAIMMVLMTRSSTINTAVIALIA